MIPLFELKWRSTLRLNLSFSICHSAIVCLVFLHAGCRKKASSRAHLSSYFTEQPSFSTVHGITKRRDSEIRSVGKSYIDEITVLVADGSRGK